VTRVYPRTSAITNVRGRRRWATTAASGGIVRALAARELNDTDRAIIAHLQREGRATYAQIAQRVGLSPAAVHERVKKLEARGVITGYRAVVDPEHIGAGVTAFIMVTQTARPRSALETAFERMPWVEECHHIAGEESLMLKVRAESTRALEHLIWEIRALHSVERTKTVVVLGTEFEGRPVSPIAPDADVPQAEQSAGSG
jgi:Lrp/AsnC family leucine-responsive transcriptional regulator